MPLKITVECWRFSCLCYRLVSLRIYPYNLNRLFNIMIPFYLFKWSLGHLPCLLPAIYIFPLSLVLCLAYVLWIALLTPTAHY